MNSTPSARSHCLITNLGLLAVLLVAAPARGQTGLRFDGSNDYVTFGSAADLGVSTFTLETWFYLEGPGVAVSTGSGGVTALPLITKGRGEADGDNRDMNFFLGIRSSDMVLAADFEEGTGQTQPGLNHPVAGVTTVRDSTWYHAAATFDGTTWRLYLNGILEAQLDIGAGRLPQSASIQHAGLATAMTSSGAASGYFEGLLDEPRIWNYARSGSEIAAGMAGEIASGAGLVGRWGLNEGSGTTAGNSVGGGSDGTLVNGPAWVPGTPFVSTSSLRLGPSSAYVTFGNEPALGLGQFTLETWFRRDGAGTSASTGAGGVVAIPLVTKGRGEADGDNRDMNYFLGIRESDGVLVADFEEGGGGSSPGLNHPIAGVTPVQTGVWQHAAVTYDGTSWALYLDGELENTLAVGQPPQSASIQHSGLGTAMTSSGATAGSFDGALDEVRIWNHARTEAEIQASVNDEITSAQTGLVARWGLDEGAGSGVHGSAGTAIDGMINGTGYAWDDPAPFDIVIGPPTAPLAPTGLSAAAVGSFQIDLSWTDNSDNEDGFAIERSTNGSGGPFAPHDTVGTNATAYSDGPLTPATEFCYRVRAFNDVGSSDWSDTTCATTPALAEHALDLGGTDAYVTFGPAPEIGLGQFTIETWFRRDGTGSTSNTGTGGVFAVPLVTKGRGEAEGSNVDMNWFFGIRGSDGVLAADFEEGAGGTSPGLNHPITGTTPIVNGEWYHGAVTYDGSTWRLYLDGLPEGELMVGEPPQANSVQHAALGSALNSSGVPEGHLDGLLDEVRVWNYARSLAEIQATINDRITTPTAGLVARWGLDEGAGSNVWGGAGTAVHGSVAGSNWSWTGPAPFDIVILPPSPPDPPTDLLAEGTSPAQIDLTWTDASDNENGFAIERSATGAGGPFAPLDTVGVNATAYADLGLPPETEYCYRVRAFNGEGSSAWSDTSCATTTEAGEWALDFHGTDAYVTFGQAPALGLAQFTIETWLRRDGPGVSTSTGTGGVTAIPLVTKGRGEQDGSNLDMNWFLGIRESDGVLCADFEEGAGGSSPGLNHPVTGTTPVTTGQWHHAAVTYDGSTWKLYLDGIPDGELLVGEPPQSASIQHAALASALTSTGTADGWFDGVLDEVRVWDHARSAAEIQAAVNSQIEAPATGLVARWGLDEGSGTTVASTAGTVLDGTITGAAWHWTGGAPFDLVIDLPPAPPALVQPADGATGVSLSPALEVAVSDPEAGPVTVSFYGRPKTTASGPPFSLIMLPDTQYYSAELNGGSTATFRAQAQFAVDSLTSLNIAFVDHVGDIVEHGDNVPAEWDSAGAAMSLLEDPVATGLPEGIPYSASVGNHDQTPAYDPNGTTTGYNTHFGVGHFAGRTYYGGNWGSNNDSHFSLFSASGLDFIVVSLEVGTSSDPAVMAWADSLLGAHGDRRAIVSSHILIGTGNPGAWSTGGQAIYDALKDNPNLFLMLCGHNPGEGRRTDVFGGNTVHTLLADYQSRTNGGNGWLRILTFVPELNELQVRTFSPTLDQYETDGDSQFTLPVELSPLEEWQLIGTVTDVPSGTNASVVWPGRNPQTEYEWYATVSDGNSTVTGPVWSFTTGSAPPAVTVVAPNGGETLTVGETAALQWTASDDVGVASIDLYLSRTGSGGSYETLALGLPDTGSWDWTVTTPPTTDAFLKVVAWDGDGNSAADTSNAAFTIFDPATGAPFPRITEFALDLRSAHPARGTVRLHLAVPRDGRVKLSLYDVQGRLVAILADREFPPGEHAVDWDGRTAHGRAGAGVYFLRMDAPDRELVRKLVLVH